MYGSETWTLQKQDIRRLEAFEMWIWRHTKVSWTEHKTNEVLQMVDTEKEIMDTLRSRQKRWLGHILRHDSSSSSSCSFNKNNDKRIVTVKTRKNTKKTLYNAVTSTNVCTAAE